MILLDAAPAVLPPMGEKLGKKAQTRLEKMGVEIQLGAMVTDVDRNGITVKDSDGTIRRIECGMQGVVGRGVGQPAGPRPRRPVRRRARPRGPGEGAARTCRSPATRTSSSSATWRRSTACPAWRRARSRAPSTSANAIKAELKGADPASPRAVPVLRQGLDGHGVAVLRGRPDRQARVRRLHRLAGLAGAAPGLPGRVQDQGHHAAVLDGDVPEPPSAASSPSPSSRRTPAPGSSNSRRSRRRCKTPRRRPARARCRPATSTGSRRPPVRAASPAGVDFAFRDSAIR